MPPPVKAGAIFCKAGAGANSKNATVGMSNGSPSSRNRSANLAQVLFRSRGPVAIAYIPRGPIFDPRDIDGLRRLFAQIDAVCKKRRALYLMVEPDSALPFSGNYKSEGLRARFRTLPAVAHRENSPPGGRCVARPDAPKDALQCATRRTARRRNSAQRRDRRSGRRLLRSA